MSEADGDLRLNSVARFQKRSDGLVLEEHGSCEVPAGCGGVVLRWVNRGQQQGAVSVTLEANGPFQAWIDDVPLENSLAWLGVGEHVLAIELTSPDPQHACLVQGFGRVRAPIGLTDRLSTRDDGSWLACTVSPVGDAWRRADFVTDERWRPLTARPWSLPRRDFMREWLDDHGAVSLGLDAAAPGVVRVRTRFTLVLERPTGGAP